jgi:hypothetical protein
MTFFTKIENKKQNKTKNPEINVESQKTPNGQSSPE